MSTELALPSKTIVPKPTKNEIIAAMVVIAREKFMTEREALIKARDQLSAKISKRYNAAFKAHLKSLKITNVGFTHSGKPEIYIGYVQLDPDEESVRLHKELTEAENAAKICFDEVATRSRLRERFLNVGSHADRVHLLLNDGNSKAYLTELLETHAGICFDEVIAEATSKCARLEMLPPYKGEEKSGTLADLITPEMMTDEQIIADLKSAEEMGADRD